MLLGLTIVVLGDRRRERQPRRRDAATAVGRQASSVLVDAEDLYVALADADAGASTAYLRAGLEPPALRTRYTATSTTPVSDSPPSPASPRSADAARPAIAAIELGAARLRRLVESARTNSRHEFPLGAAYLRRASDLMRSHDPARRRRACTTEAAQQLYRSYRAGSVALARADDPARRRCWPSAHWSPRRCSWRGGLVACLNVGLLGRDRGRRRAGAWAAAILRRPGAGAGPLAGARLRSPDRPVHGPHPGASLARATRTSS